MRLSAVVPLLLAACCAKYDKRQLPNALPVASVAVSPAGNVAGGTTLTLDGTASTDPEGRALQYRWTQVAGEPVTPTAPDAAITEVTVPQDGQVLVFALEVHDGFQDSAPAYARVVVDNRTRPVADAGEAREVVNGASVLLSGRASDPDGDAIVSHAWSLLAAPVVEGVERTHVLSATDVATPVFQPFVKGLFLLSYTVTDARGDTSLPATVAVRSLNAPPQLRAGAPRHTRNLEPVTLSVDASDADPGDLARLEWRWTLDSAPSGAPLPVVDGLEQASLDVTPLARGLYAFTVVATDGESESVSARVLLAADNNPPSASAASFHGRMGVAMALAVASPDPDGDVVVPRWAMADAGGRPFALQADPAGAATFTPGAKGRYVLRATPFDGTDEGAPVEVVVDVDNAPPTVVVLSGEPGPDGLVIHAKTGRDVPLAARASDPDGDDVSGLLWSVTGVPGAADPPPFVLSGAGTATPVFTPLRKGVFVLRVVARDADGAESAPAVVRVDAGNAAPVVSLPNLVEGVNLQPSAITATATDADGSDVLTYAWTLVDAPPNAALPLLAGLSGSTIAVTPRGKGLYVRARGLRRRGDGARAGAVLRR